MAGRMRDRVRAWQGVYVAGGMHGRGCMVRGMHGRGRGMHGGGHAW